jgi:hypothetical protein
MNTALVLTQLIVVASLPSGVCATDAECERIAWREFGCQTYYSDRDDEGSGLYICDRDTFERKQKELAK